MNKKQLFLGILMTVTTAANAQQKNGGISADMLQQISKGSVSANQNKALYNALTANSIDNLAKNHANSGKVDTYFSVETPKQNIHNQKSSGRCWMCTGLNVLRANFAKAHNDTLSVEYSHSYLFFYINRHYLLPSTIKSLNLTPFDSTTLSLSLISYSLSEVLE